MPTNDLLVDMLMWRRSREGVAVGLVNDTTFVNGNEAAVRDPAVEKLVDRHRPPGRGIGDVQLRDVDLV